MQENFDKMEKNVKDGQNEEQKAMQEKMDKMEKNLKDKMEKDLKVGQNEIATENAGLPVTNRKFDLKFIS